MKKIILICAALWCFWMPSFAQVGGLERIQEVVKSLDLTNAQQAELQDLLQELADRRSTIRTMPRSAKKRQLMRDLGDYFKVGLGNILTNEQIVQLKEMRRENREDRLKLRNWMAENKAQLKEMKQEIKAYSRENIKPKILELRTDLDRSITAEDQALITELREEAKALKKARRAKREALKESLAQESEREERNRRQRAIQEERRRKHQDEEVRWKAQHPEMWKQAQALIARYQTEIDALFETMESDRTVWKQDISDIAERYTASMPLEDKSKLNRKIDAYIKKFGKSKERKYLTFLLMKPDGSGEEMTTFEGESEAGVTDVAIYPNPATSEQTLSIELESAGSVRIEIVDKTGLVLYTVHNGYLSAGTHTFQNKISKLEGYVFYYRIQTSEGTLSREFIKK